MDFQTLRQSFFNRGFEHMDDNGPGLAECKRLVNEAMHQLNDERAGQWPFLEASSSGAAPLTISDLGTIESVWDSTHSTWLTPADRRDLGQWYADQPLTSEGAPEFFYVANGVVKVYPVQAVTLNVRYWKVADDLSDNTDEPLMPARFHGAIVDLAVAGAHRLHGNEAEAQAAQAEAQRKVDLMAERLLGGQQDAGPAYVMPLSGTDN